MHETHRIELLKQFCAINSGTFHLSGLTKMLAALREAFGEFRAREELIDVPAAESIDSLGRVQRSPLGRGLKLSLRPEAPRRVLLNIHYDTVFDADHAFQSVRMLDADVLNAPGACDAKGGIVVMLSALAAFEAAADSSAREQLGWTAYLNPDEEIGSPGSAEVLRELARGHVAGLLFEPALPDGSIVGARKGSGNFTAIVRGRTAHAGRDFHAGRSATVALAELITRVDEAGRALGGGVTINCGRIEGGGAVNVVPDLAIARFNLRVGETSEMDAAQRVLRDAIAHVEKRDGIAIELHGHFASPPKVIDAASQRLIDLVRSSAKEIGLGELAVKSSGGASDGNKLAAAGLPVIDTLGPVGGEIHSDREFVKLSTIAARAELTASVLLQIARGAMD